MKAVIMAGGEGTRLKAVTGDLPKPLVPMLGRPLMEHILLLLRENGFTDICAAVKYRAQDIIDCFGDGSRLGVKLQYRIEQEPLGTAGGVKNCADFYGDEDFLVISGDAACDFDLKALMRAHKQRRAAVTLALYRHPEPLSYGLAVTDAEDRVRAFIEKPAWGRVVTDLVNTGIYILSPRAMEKVPQEQRFDFAKDLFPLLLREDAPLVGLPMEGYWCDVGSPLSYYKCCVDALEGKLKIDLPSQFSPARAGDDAKPEPQADAEQLCSCRSRAALMGALSELVLDMGADYADGIQLVGRNYKLRIAPRADVSAIRIAVSSPDAEFAKELALSAKEVAQALNL